MKEAIMLNNMNKENNKINIIMAINEKFIFPTRVTIASLIANKGDELIDIYILHFNISENGVKLLESGSTDTVKIKCIQIDEKEIPDVKIYFEFSKEIMIKLFAHRYLPENLKKVLWLDSDIVILKSLIDFYNQEMNKYYFIGFEDQKIKKRDFERLEIPNDYGYFNVGVMLMNLEIMRNTSYERDVLDFFKTCKLELTYPEQDMINLLYGIKGKILTLGYPYQFNRFADSLHKKEIKSQDISIIHYVGFHQKPWKGCACRHYFIWWKYAWTIPQYRSLFFKVLPKYLTNYIKKIFVKIGLILRIKKKHKNK